MVAAVLRVIDSMSNRVISVKNSATVYDATSKILRFGVGCVVVVNEGGEVVGIVTKGDILKKLVKPGLGPRKAHVDKVMSRKVVTVGKDATLEEASRLMTEKKVSKLPVVEDGKLVGIITSTDIIRAEPMHIGYLEELVNARFVPHRVA